MKNNRSVKEDAIVTISGGRKSNTEKLDSYRYWEIAGELIWRGVDRLTAQDTAKWCNRAEVGSQKEIQVKDAPAITVKIKEKK